MTTFLQQQLGQALYSGNVLGVNLNGNFLKQAIFKRIAIEVVEIVREKFEAKESWRINSNSRRRIARFTGANPIPVCLGLSYGDKKNARYTAHMDGIWSDLESAPTAEELFRTITASRYLMRVFGEVISKGDSLKFGSYSEKHYLVSAMSDLRLHARNNCLETHQFFAEWEAAASYGLHREVLKIATSIGDSDRLKTNVKQKRAPVTAKIL